MGGLNLDREFTLTDFYSFVQNHLTERSLAVSNLVAALGYKNIPKGIRKLGRTLSEGFDRSALTATDEAFLLRLAQALNVPFEDIVAAADVTFRAHREAERKTHEEQERIYRERFVPHAYIIGEHSIPSQITIYGMTGGANRWLRLPIDVSQPRWTYAKQAFDALQNAQRDSQGRLVAPFFGLAVGFIVNYSPDRAMRFDLDGRMVALIKGAYRPGVAYAETAGRRLPAIS